MGRVHTGSTPGWVEYEHTLLRGILVLIRVHSLHGLSALGLELGTFSLPVQVPRD